MHRKYAQDGFVAFSVTCDEASDTKARSRALAFLQKQGAEFTNVLLAEEPALWQTKLKIDGTPCVYLFNRANRFVLKRDGVGADGRIDYVLFEQKIRELLAEGK